MKTPGIAVSIALALSALSCNVYQEVHMQTPTFVNLQVVAMRIQEVVEREGEIPTAEAMEIVKWMNEGKDAWGEPIVYISRKDPAFSFVVISKGRDRQLDNPDADIYFSIEEMDIIGNFDRDIVFRDGRPLATKSPKWQ